MLFEGRPSELQAPGVLPGIIGWSQMSSRNMSSNPFMVSRSWASLMTLGKELKRRGASTWKLLSL
jgi:hypothetical protein